jgi:hypothetical protein
MELWLSPDGGKIGVAGYPGVWNSKTIAVVS